MLPPLKKLYICFLLDKILLPVLTYCVVRKLMYRFLDVFVIVRPFYPAVAIFCILLAFTSGFDFFSIWMLFSTDVRGFLKMERMVTMPVSRKRKLYRAAGIRGARVIRRRITKRHLMRRGVTRVAWRIMRARKDLGTRRRLRSRLRWVSKASRVSSQFRWLRWYRDSFRSSIGNFLRNLLRKLLRKKERKFATEAFEKAQVKAEAQAARLRALQKLHWRVTTVRRWHHCYGASSLNDAPLRKKVLWLRLPRLNENAYELRGGLARRGKIKRVVVRPAAFMKRKVDHVFAWAPRTGGLQRKRYLRAKQESSGSRGFGPAPYGPLPANSPWHRKRGVNPEVVSRARRAMKRFRSYPPTWNYSARLGIKSWLTVNCVCFLLAVISVPVFLLLISLFACKFSVNTVTFFRNVVVFKLNTVLVRLIKYLQSYKTTLIRYRGRNLYQRNARHYWSMKIWPPVSTVHYAKRYPGARWHRRKYRSRKIVGARHRKIVRRWVLRFLQRHHLRVGRRLRVPAWVYRASVSTGTTITMMYVNVCAYWQLYLVTLISLALVVYSVFLPSTFENRHHQMKVRLVQLAKTKNLRKNAGVNSSIARRYKARRHWTHREERTKIARPEGFRQWGRRRHRPRNKRRRFVSTQRADELNDKIVPESTTMFINPTFIIPSSLISYIPTPLRDASLDSVTLVRDFLPETALLSMIVFVLIGIGITLGRGQSKYALTNTCATFSPRLLVITCGLFILQAYFIEECVLFGGYFYSALGLTISKLIVAFSSLYVLYASKQYVRRNAHRRHFLEYFLLLTFATLLLFCVVGANNLFSLYFAVGGFSLNLYVLILFDVNSRVAREASLKYFVLSALSTGILIFGIFLLYYAVQTVTYGELCWIFGVWPFDTVFVYSGVFLIILGLFFKLSAFPAHLWAPDIYEGSSAPVMAFFLMPVKAAVLIAFARLLYSALADLSSLWLPVLSLASTGSLLWGAYAAFVESKISRFLGYASINQIGYLLLGIACDSDAGLAATTIYLITYLVMSAGFLLIYIFTRRKNKGGLRYLGDFRGLGVHERGVALSMVIVLFSSAGIPPLLGFHVKYFVLVAAMTKQLYVSAVVGLGVSLLSAYYYLQFITFSLFEAVDRVYPVRVQLTPRWRAFAAAIDAALVLSPVSASLLLAAIGPVVLAMTSADVQIAWESFALFGDTVSVNTNVTVCSCDTLLLAVWAREQTVRVAEWRYTA